MGKDRAVQMRIPGIRACVFDAYGTLFDVHAAIGRYRRERRGMLTTNFAEAGAFVRRALSSAKLR